MKNERCIFLIASIVEKGLKYVIQKDYLQSKSDCIWATLTTNVKAMGMDTCMKLSCHVIFITHIA